MSSIFDNIDKITDFEIISFTSRSGYNEPDCGFIRYNEKNYHFSFNHEFDVGNTYIVYDSFATPIYYFMIITEKTPTLVVGDESDNETQSKIE